MHFPFYQSGSNLFGIPIRLYIELCAQHFNRRLMGCGNNELFLRVFLNFEIGLPVQFHFTGTGSELTGKSQRTFSVYPYHCSVSKRHLRTLSGRHIYGLHFYIFLLQGLYQHIT